MRKRVAVTGLGIISPVGIGKETVWQNLLAGKSGIKRITAFDTTDFAVRIAGEVEGFTATDYMDRKEARHMDRFAHFGVAAAKMAVEDAKIDWNALDHDRIGAVVGTGIGGITTIEEASDRLANRGPSRVSPFAIPMMIANMAAGQISIALDVRGPVITDVTACASGTNAIGDALRMIRYGDADIVIAGGAEAAISPVSRRKHRVRLMQHVTVSFSVRARPCSYWKNGTMRSNAARIFMRNCAAMGRMVMRTILRHRLRKVARPKSVWKEHYRMRN